MSHTSDHLELPQIIHRPELQGRFRRGALAMLSVVCWAIWLYLFAPLLTLLGWAFGYDRLQDYALANAEYTSYTVFIYAVLIAAAGLSLLFWALYNLLRFRNKNRRGRLHAVTPQALAEAFGVSVGDIEQMHRADHIVIDYDENGQIRAVDTHPRDTIGR
jgi:poly-beta-1,6-N-acetyl-D-glucosamine biosynthesis protein PgaD